MLPAEGIDYHPQRELERIMNNPRHDYVKTQSDCLKNKHDYPALNTSAIHMPKIFQIFDFPIKLACGNRTGMISPPNTFLNS